MKEVCVLRRTIPPDNADYHHNRMITDEVIAQTLANPTIQLNGNFDTNLKKIIEQKYVAGFYAIALSDLL